MVPRTSRLARVLRCTAVVSLLPVGAAAQQGTPDSTTYVLSAASRFEFSGRIVYHPGAPAQSRLEIVVPTESLEVLTPPDTAEIRKVTEAMRTEVLHVDQYSEIRFTSTAVTPTGDGLRVQGELTLAGQTRDVTVDVAVEIGADTLRARGTFALKQTDFGIKPYRGGPAGTVRVADRVTLDFEAIGVAQAGP